MHGWEGVSSWRNLQESEATGHTGFVILASAPCPHWTLLLLLLLNSKHFAEYLLYLVTRINRFQRVFA